MLLCVCIGVENCVNWFYFQSVVINLQPMAQGQVIIFAVNLIIVEFLKKYVLIFSVSYRRKMRHNWYRLTLVSLFSDISHMNLLQKSLILKIIVYKFRYIPSFVSIRLGYKLFLLE